MSVIPQPAWYAVALIVFIAVVRKPWLGLALYYTLALVHPEYIWPDPFEAYRISLIVGATTVLGLAITIKSDGVRIANLKQAVPLLVLGLFLLVNFSHYTADLTSDDVFVGTFDPDSIVQYFNKMIIFFVISLLVLKNWFQLYSLILVLAASVIFLTVWFHVLYFSDVGISQIGPNDILKRVAGPGIYADENVFATILVVGISVLYYLSLTNNRLWVKAVCYFSLYAILHAFYLTGSRGGLFAAVVVVLYIGIRSKSKKTGVAVVLLFLTVLAVQGQTVIERYNDTLATYAETQDASSINVRQTIWSVAFEIIKKNLWTGIGTGRFQLEQLSYTPYVNTRGIECTGKPCNTHNTFLEFTTSAGIAAGIMYLALFLFVAIQLRVELKNRHLLNHIHIARSDGSRLNLRDFSKHSGDMLVSALLGIFACSLFLNFMIFELLYFLFILFVVRTTLIKHRLANGTPQKISKSKRRLISSSLTKPSKPTREPIPNKEPGKTRRRRTDSLAKHKVETSRSYVNVAAKEENTTKTTTKLFFRHIEGLRAVAVISVILFHLNPAYLPGGFIGVDIFFVISGFVISHSLSGRQYPSFGNFISYFYTRRIARVVPALIVCLFVTTLFSTLFIPAAQTDPTLPRTGVFAFLGLSNIYLASSIQDYFAAINGANPFLHTWSLSIEEQFYLLFPLLFYPWINVSTGGKAKLSVCLFAIGAIASFALAFYYTSANPKFAFYSIATRFWELAAGVLLYQYCIKSPHYEFDVVKPQGGGRIVGLAGATLLLIGFLFADKSNFPMPWALVAVVGTIALIYSFLGEKTHNQLRPLRAILESGTARYLGRISYSLYLWHWPVFMLAHWTVGLETPSATILAVILVAILSVWSYHSVELRWIKHSQHAPAHTTIAAGIVCMSIGAGVAHTLYIFKPALSFSAAADGSRWLPTSDALQNVETGDCTSDIKFEPFATTSPVDTSKHQRTVFTANCPDSAGRNRTLFTLGDSHAWTHRRLFRTVATRIPLDIITYSTGGCPYPDSYAANQNYAGHCSAFHSASKQDVLALARPGDILYLPGGRINGMPKKWRTNQSPSYVTTTAYDIGVEQWQAALAPFIEKGMLILLEHPKPVFGSPAYRCMDWFNESSRLCGSPRQVGKAIMLKYAEPVIQSMTTLTKEDPHVFLWNPMELLCPGSVCDSVIQQPGESGQLEQLFFDENHLATPALERLFEPFMENLEVLLKLHRE